jgi:ATP-dependent Lhr-like helicase
MVVLSAADPLNLVGILVPGERVPAISGRTVTFRDGVVVQEHGPTDSQQFAATGD